MNISLDDFEKKAAQVLPKKVFNFFAGGTCDELTLRQNSEALRSWRLRPRVLRNVKSIDTSTSVLGLNLSFPLLIPPMAQMALAHKTGERGMSQAAAKAQIGFVLSMNSNMSMEECSSIHEKPTRPPNWFQLYVLEDRKETEALVHRAATAGYNGICITVDRAVRAKRERELRAKFSIPKNLKSGNLQSFAGGNMAMGSKVFGARTIEIDAGFSWSDLEWLKSVCPLPIILKGILHPEDAKLAVKAGADAIVVSNHGGRQLDRVVSGIEALPPIIDSVANQIEVLVDGGFRRGTDIALALCLGARAVLVGRPMLWALATGGEKGVLQAISILHEEFRETMALLGCTSVSQLNSEYIMP